MYILKYMFLKREWPETEDFAIKKYLVVKKKYYSIFQEITLAVTLKKKSENVFAYSCVSEHSEHF